MRQDSSIADRYNSYGAGTPYEGMLEGWATPKYKPPIGVNLLVYLQVTSLHSPAAVLTCFSVSFLDGPQDMTTETGPLRIVPASHLGYPPTPTADDKALPHPQEQLLDAHAGDMVVSRAATAQI